MGVLIMIVMFAVFFAEAKVNTCRHKFHSDKWSYCTKFGVGPNTKMKVQYRSKLVNYVKTPAIDDQTVYFEIAIYQDDQWDELQNK